MNDHDYKNEKNPDHDDGEDYDTEGREENDSSATGKSWRQERREYAEYWSKREVGDLSALDEFEHEFDEKFGPGPSKPRDVSTPIASTVNSSDGGQWDALPLEFLHSLVGGDCDGAQILAPGPGHSFNDRSMSVRPSTQTIDGFVVHSFSPRTDDMECKEYVRFLYEYRLYDQLKDDPSPVSSPVTPYTPQSWLEAAQAIGSQPQSPSQPAREVMDKEQRVKSAKQQWNCVYKKPLGESVYKYLRSRGLELPETFKGRVVAYKRDGWWYESNGGCVDKKGLPYSESEVMLLACRDVLTDEGRAVQFVRLPHVGKRPQRKVKGAIANAAIKLTKHQDVLAAGELTIGEGFETCLAAMMLGHHNVWACVSADNIEKFPVIDGVRKLTILVENGCKANAKARFACAERWMKAGREVAFAIPSEDGKDFNDELMALNNCGVE